ncbi:hypothetical protein [Rhodanobacter denitrificans]|uniref:hypothetical protein n=1 Tax=Rhodanobacter denitrificans TaxID=666685 RepID=UPI001F1B608F|nr:hypothetical protein [Rhodanobacter denitrificans]UJJ60406.1 hypothetical protein LRK55_18375 [Rhodanobacter denitrificans]
MQHEVVGSVRIGPEWVSIKRRGTSGVDTARILGRTGEGDDLVIYLDRVLHRQDGEVYGDGWQARGALVTELYRGD